MKSKAIIMKSLSYVIGILAMIFIVAAFSRMFNEKIIPGKIESSAEKMKEGAQTAKAEKISQPINEEATGTIIASTKTSVSSRIMASIKTIKVRSGDTVKKGDVIATLDDRDIASKSDQAKDALTSAKTQMANAEKEYQRFDELFKKGIATKREFDNAEAAFNVAKAEVARIEKQVEESNIAVSYSEIVSPVNGKVVERFAEPGDIATPGKPIIQLYDPNALQLEAFIREKLAVKIKAGDTMKVHVDALEKELDGTVDEIVPQSELGSRVFRVKIGLPFTSGLFTGMYGRLQIPTGEKSMTVIPVKAVEVIGQNRFVTSVDKDGFILRRLITTGQVLSDGRIEVLSGLTEGDMIVVK